MQPDEEMAAPESLWKFLEKNPEYHEQIKKHFETLLHEQGSNLNHRALFSVKKYLICLSDEIKLEDIDHVTSFDELREIMSVLSEARKEALLNSPDLKNRFSVWIQNIHNLEQLVNILSWLPKDAHLSLLQGIIKRSTVFRWIKNRADFLKILNYLSTEDKAAFLALLATDSNNLCKVLTWLTEDDRMLFLQSMGDRLGSLINTHVDIWAILLELPKKHHAAFLALASVKTKLAEIFTNSADLEAILCLLSADAHLPFLQGVGDKLPSLLHTSQDVLNILKNLSTEDKAAFLQLAGVKTKLAVIKYDDDSLNTILSCLPEDDRLPFLQSIGNELSTFIYRCSSISEILKHLPQKHHKAFLELPGTKAKLARTIQWAPMLNYVLCHLSKDAWLPFLQSMKDQLDNLEVFMYGSQLQLKYISTEHYGAFLWLLTAIVKNNYHLRSALTCLSADNRLPTLQGIADKLPALIQGCTDLVEIIELLPQKDRAKFLELVGKDKLFEVIKNSLHVSRILCCLSEDTCLPFLQRIADRLYFLISTDSDRVNIVKYLPEKYYVAFLELAKTKLRLKNSNDLCNILCCLSADNCLSFLQDLGNKLGKLIKNQDDLQKILSVLISDKFNFQAFLHMKGIQNVVFQSDIKHLLATCAGSVLTPNEQQHLLRSIALRKMIEQSVNELEAKAESIGTKFYMKYTTTLELVNNLRETTHKYFSEGDLADKDTAKLYVKACETHAAQNHITADHLEDRLLPRRNGFWRNHQSHIGYHCHCASRIYAVGSSFHAAHLFWPNRNQSQNRDCLRRSK